MNVENRNVNPNLIDNIEALRTAINEISVYDLNTYTAIELYYRIANKLNEVINELLRHEIVVSEQVINQNECLQYLLNEGLNNEVVQKIDEMVADGTMDTIINHKIFNLLSSKVKDIEQNKMDKNTTDISIRQINKNMGKIDQSYLDDTLLQQIVGTTPINAVPTNLSITQDKMVTPYVEATQGKNLFNKYTVTKGFYVDYRNGNKVEAESFNYSAFIRVKPNTQYTCLELNQVAFYDVDKNFISGGTTAPFTTPANTSFCIISTKNSMLDIQQLEKGTVNTYYEKYVEEIDKKYITNSFVNKINNKLKELNGRLHIELIQGKNLFNKKTVVKGYYIDASTGAIRENQYFNYSDYIRIEENTQYVCSAFNQISFYNINKEYIGGITESNNGVFTTPKGTEYCVLTTANNKLDIQQLEKGSEVTSYEEYRCYINPDFIKNNNTEKLITVGADKDFANLRLAVESITDNSKNNPYVIKLDEGVYDIKSCYSQSEIENSNFIGLIIGEGISLEGVGNVDKTIIKWEFDNNTSSDLYYRISPLNLKGEGRLKNITVIGRNTRYAVHDDWNYPNQEHYAENCKFYKYGLGLPKAYGAGIWSGMRYIFENCYFYSDSDVQPYACHNNTAEHFENPSLQRFINCTFESKGNFASLGFGSMGSNQDDTIELINCNLGGRINFYEELSNGVGCDFKLKLIGCNSIPLNIISAKEWSPNFITNEVMTYKNASSNLITKGDVVSFSQNEGSIIPYNGIFSGVALENIDPNGTGKVRIGGYLSNFESGNTFSSGQKIGVSNNKLTFTTDNNYIGYVYFDGFMKFI